MLYLLLKTMKLLLPRSLLPFFCECQPLLVGKAGRSLLPVLPVRHPGHRNAADRLAPELFQMYHDIRRSLDQGLVMGYEKHRALCLQKKFLQPDQRLHI